MGLFSSQIATKKMVPLCRQLATEYEAGIPIINSLDRLAKSQKHGATRDLMTRVGDDIRRGSTLGEAIRAESKYLPPFLVELLAGGEAGGRLDVMLRDVADYFEDRLAMQRQVMLSVAYPCIQLVAAWFLVTFSYGLIGRVMSSESRGGISLISDFLKDYAVFQGKALVVAAVLFACSVLLSRAGLLKWVRGAVTTHVWPLSLVTRRFALARFFRSMSLLIASGMRIDHCIEHGAAITGNPYIQKDLLKAVPRVRDGQSLVEAFSESKQLTGTAREMLAVGEQTGKLDTQLRKVSEYHLQEARQAVSIASKVFSVAVAIGVAGTIGFFIIMFYMRLYGGIYEELGI